MTALPASLHDNQTLGGGGMHARTGLLFLGGFVPLLMCAIGSVAYSCCARRTLLRAQAVDAAGGEIRPRRPRAFSCTSSTGITRRSRSLAARVRASRGALAALARSKGSRRDDQQQDSSSWGMELNDAALAAGVTTLAFGDEVEGAGGEGAKFQ